MNFGFSLIALWACLVISASVPQNRPVSNVAAIAPGESDPSNYEFHPWDLQDKHASNEPELPDDVEVPEIYDGTVNIDEAKEDLPDDDDDDGDDDEDEDEDTKSCKTDDDRMEPTECYNGRSTMLHDDTLPRDSASKSDPLSRTGRSHSTTGYPLAV
ncbi:hypothetical protein BDV59DRAFT_206181 [Aspergillus ambiguus]|uniref:uncharacterized protein n=1 Tax=Aspergillus ambiguus TaxID=176160 RepID=UPI003CCCC597